MKHINLFRAIWFNEEKDERSWFAIQVATYYSFCRRSVVLYALKRLGLIFRMSFTSLDGNIELRALYDNFEQINRSRRFSFLLPRELIRNPLQTVLCDYSCAEDDYGDMMNGLRGSDPMGLRGSDPIGGVRMVGWAFLCYTIAYEKVTQFFYRSLLSPRKSCC